MKMRIWKIKIAVKPDPRTVGDFTTCGGERGWIDLVNMAAQFFDLKPGEI